VTCTKVPDQECVDEVIRVAANEPLRWRLEGEGPKTSNFALLHSTHGGRGLTAELWPGSPRQYLGKAGDLL
jgi:hypothetical protein